MVVEYLQILQDNYQSYGICGRIPPRLFKPISNVSKLEGIFYYCFMVNPYTWPSVTDSGYMYPEKFICKIKNSNFLLVCYFLTTKEAL